MSNGQLVYKHPLTANNP